MINEHIEAKYDFKVHTAYVIENVEKELQAEERLRKKSKKGKNLLKAIPKKKRRDN